MAWTLYSLYGNGLWPLGTLLAGLGGLSLLWPSIAAAPLLLIDVGSDRQRQRTEARPASAMNSIIVMLITLLLKLLFFFYLGVAIDRYWG